MLVTGEFDDLVRATATRLLRTCVLLCGDHHEAEDLLQSTYAKVFSKWRLVRAAENPVAYTRTVLMRTFLSDRRRRRVPEQLYGEVPDPPTRGPDVPLRLALLDALAGLKPDDRAVLVLRYWEDLSVSDTAAMLGITESACRTRASRALAKLRTTFPELED